jgi:hypothetical protein
MVDADAPTNPDVFAGFLDIYDMGA